MGVFGFGLKGRSPLAKVVVVVIALAGTVIAAEVVLRLFVDLPNNHHRLFCEYDPLLGWRKVPNRDGWHITEEYKVRERFNSRGLRGPEYSYDKPADGYRVLMLGDSFVEGYSVDFDDLHSERLAALLEAALDRPVEVINAGTGGYSTDQQLLFFESEGHRYQPDLTVVVFYENDLLYNAQPNFFRGQKPMFVLDESGSLQLTNVPPPRRERSRQRRMADWTLDHVRLARLVSLAIRDNAFLHGLAADLRLTSPPPAPDRPAARTAGASVPFDSRIYVTPNLPEVDYAWRVTEALLERLRDRTAAAGGQLLILYAPAQHIVLGDICRDLGRKYGLPATSCDHRQLPKGLAEMTARLGIPFIDPVPELEAEAARLEPLGRRLYYRLDGHWNADGNRLVAEILANHILDPDRRPSADGGL